MSTIKDDVVLRVCEVICFLGDTYNRFRTGIADGLVCISTQGISSHPTTKTRHKISERKMCFPHYVIIILDTFSYHHISPIAILCIMHQQPESYNDKIIPRCGLTTKHMSSQTTGYQTIKCSPNISQIPEASGIHQQVYFAWHDLLVASIGVV